MERTPFASAADGLQALLGVAASDPSVIAVLRELDGTLRAFAHDLECVLPAPWRTSGLTLDDYPGPPRQRRLSGYVHGGDVTFGVELARGDFYANCAELGRAPHRYYAEAEVYVVSKAPVSAGDQLVMALQVRETESAAEGVEALAVALASLRSEASRRPPTAPSWRALRQIDA